MNLKLLSFRGCISGLIILAIIRPSDEIGAELVIGLVGLGLAMLDTIITIKNEVTPGEDPKEVTKFPDDVFSELNSINKHTESLNQLSQTLHDEIKRLIDELSVKFDLSIVYDYMAIVNEVNSLYDKEFLRYFQKGKSYDPTTIDRYVNNVLSNDFKHKLNLLDEMATRTGVGVKNFFDVTRDFLNLKVQYNRTCGSSSVYEQMYVVHQLSIAALVKGYHMHAHGYKYLQQNTSSPSSWIEEMRDAKEDYVQATLRINQTIDEHLQVMHPKKYRESFRCNPIKWKEGKYYERLRNFLSWVIWPTHTENTGHPENYCDGNSTIDHVSEIHVDEVCYGSPTLKRRFMYAIRNSPKFFVYGDANYNCPKDKIEHYKDGQNHLTFVCDENENINLQPFRRISHNVAFTAYYQDWFITGVRFRVSPRGVLYIEVQQGQLVNGTIDPKIVAWQPYENSVTAHDTDTFLHWRKKKVYLDDIVLPDGYLAAGLKFKEEEDHVKLVVYGQQKYDESGKPIINGTVKIFESFNPEDSRRELFLDYLDVPTKGPNENFQRSKPGENYVQFQVTDIVKDMGQNVIPFIDIQEVTTNPPAPLSGFGLFYKNQPGYGGFIALKQFVSNHQYIPTKTYR